MRKIAVKNKIISFYNLYTKLKWWRKLLILGYLLFAFFAVIFFIIQMKYPLRVRRPNLNHYPAIKTLGNDYLHLDYDEEITTQGAYKLRYNNKTKSIDLYYQTTLLTPIPLKQYGLDKSYDETTLNNHFQYPTDREANLLSPFFAYLSYSSAPGAAREITYPLISLNSVKRVAHYHGVLFDYQINSDPFDNTLFPKAISGAKMKELIRKIKKHFNNDPTAYQDYLASLVLSYIKSGDETSNSLYNFILPADDILLHKRNLKYIWYQIYQLKDNELMRFNPNARINKYSFNIPLMYYLDDDGFKVSIISELIKEKSIVVNNSKWQLSSIKVNPNFLLSSKIKTTDIIVPDGNGALITDMDTRWNGVVYNATKFLTATNYAQIPPEIKIPVMGLIKDNGLTRLAAYFYLSEGASNANLYLDPFLDYTRIYPEFFLRRTGNATFIGESTTQAQSPAYFDTRFTVNYHFLSGASLTYFDIAKDFANKYIQSEKIIFQPDIAIELIGAITKLNHILGIPYYQKIPLTTFSEAQKIIDLVKPYARTYFYNNWQSDLTYRNIPAQKTKALRALGNPNDLTTSNIYYIQSFLKTYQNNYQKFANRLNGMQTLANETKKLYDYSPITNSEGSDKKNRYYLLNNKFLLDTVHRFQKTSYHNLAIDDFNIPNYDYSDKYFSPRVNDIIKHNSIKMLKRQQIALNYPPFNLLDLINLIYGIKLPTNNRPNIKSPIPLYQLILADYYPLYLETKNLFDDYTIGDNSYYYEYQLISQTNACYTLSYRKTDVTKDSYYYNKYYACYYQDYITPLTNHQKRLMAFYQTNGTKIVGHKVVNYNVYEIKYEKDGVVKTFLFNLTGGYYLDVAPYSHKEI